MIFTLYDLVFHKENEINDTLERQQMQETLSFSNVLTSNDFKVIYISLHTSSLCNLACSYCFLKDRSNSCHMNIQMAKKFIDDIIFRYPHAEKYIVDPTGLGEPLLNMKLIVAIGEYCRVKSDEIKKEVLPMLVTIGSFSYKSFIVIGGGC